MKNTSAIDNLVDLMWNNCVKQKPADSEETLRRWQTDDYSYIKESYIIYPMPADLNEPVRHAIAEWMQIQNSIYRKSGWLQPQFVKEFKKAREDFLKKGNYGRVL